MISVVIPAYNEAAVIERTLNQVIAAAKHQATQIIVVCNGCTDNTSEIASRFEPRVQVLQLDEGSKVKALNLGDSVATGFPRFYLDGDLEISENSLSALTNALKSDAIHAVSPNMICELSRVSWPVRAFYKVWENRPYHRHGHVGGFIGLSEAGRSRFRQFPDLIADDEFVRRHFTPDERKIVREAWFRVYAPKDLWTLIRIKTRSRVGTYQVNEAYPQLRANALSRPSTCEEPAATQERTGPPSFIEKLVYGMICLIVRVRAQRAFRRGDFGHWETDHTTR